MEKFNVWEIANLVIFNLFLNAKYNDNIIFINEVLAVILHATLFTYKQY